MKADWRISVKDYRRPQHRRCGIFVVSARPSIKLRRNGISSPRTDAAPTELEDYFEKIFYKDSAPARGWKVVSLRRRQMATQTIGGLPKAEFVARIAL